MITIMWIATRAHQKISLGESAMPKTDSLMRSTPALQQSLPRTGVLLSAGIAALLGMIVLYGVGFAGPDLIHNAAHDTRHSISVPCH
jgi:cobalt transporter subunit CbtB